MTYGTPCHAISHFVFYYNHVTYRTSCHAIGHLVIYREFYRFERVFFTLRRFLPNTPSSWFQGLPGVGSLTLKLAGLYADLRNGPTICLNHSNPQKCYTGRFYLRFTAGLATWRICSSQDLNSFHDKLSMLKASCFICINIAINKTFCIHNLVKNLFKLQCF